MVERKSRLTAATWAIVQIAYEGPDESVAEIGRRFGVSPKTIHNHAVEGGWRRRNVHHQVDRSSIITRMFHVLERQIINLEENMTETGEKEVAVLGKLASTLEKLIDIDNAASQKPKGVQTKDMVDLRNKLAERIEQLKRV